MGGKETGALGATLRLYRRAFVGIGLMSGMINILGLTGSFFMLQVYDRVIPSRSLETLLGLSLLAGGLFVVLGMLEVLRARVLARVGLALDERLSPGVYGAILRLPLKTGFQGDGLRPLRDLDQVRSFLSGGGPSAFFDMPWVPLYLGICFLFHAWIGAAALGGALILVTLALLVEVTTRKPMEVAGTRGARRNALAEAGLRNSEALHAMGFGDRLHARWARVNADYLSAHGRAADLVSGLGTLSRIFRMGLQSAVLAVGAYLVVQQEATGGVMIASSIIMGRALYPIEQAIAHWRGFVAARQSWRRLSRLLALMEEPAAATALPAPTRALKVENLAVAPPGGQRTVVQAVSFQLGAGAGLGVIGPSASGKSSLARALVGVWRPARGAVRLDGAALDQWTARELGRHIGYLPQDVELFEGTVGENIARFEPGAPSSAMIAAARAADVHDLIVRLPQGYDTPVGEGGCALSAGQRQRIGLARALYRDPFLVVLDEPNSNLDAEGEAALTRAVLGVRARGGILVVVAHRPSAIAGVDHLLVMAEGQVAAFGPRDQVLRRATRVGDGAPGKEPAAPVAAVTAQSLATLSEREGELS